MTTTIADYDIRYVLVPADNEGQPCERCQEIDAVVTCTVHGVCDGEVVAPDCCAACFREVVEELDPLCRVTVHTLNGVYVDLGDDEYDDRMSGPDDNRPHPDAL